VLRPCRAAVQEIQEHLKTDVASTDVIAANRRTAKGVNVQPSRTGAARPDHPSLPPDHPLEPFDQPFARAVTRPPDTSLPPKPL
jgi:hypothetical protein